MGSAVTATATGADCFTPANDIAPPMIPPVWLSAKVTVMVAVPTVGLGKYHNSVPTKEVVALTSELLTALSGTRVIDWDPKVTVSAEQCAEVEPRSVETPTTNMRSDRPAKPPTVWDQASTELVLTAPLENASYSTVA